MSRGIYLSIKPKYMNKIVTGEKNHEFRKYYPKEKIDYLFVYESAPISSLKYIIELGKIIEYPDKINENGYGNYEFNNNMKKSKYAYQIKHVDILEIPISLKKLREKYEFYAPQAYAYDYRYPELTKKIQNMHTKRLI